MSKKNITATAGNSVADLKAAVMVKVDAAIKSSKESAKILSEGFAAAWYWAVWQGDLVPLDKLYREVTDKDKDAMRTMAILQAHDIFTPADHFGKDGKPMYRLPLVSFVAVPKDGALHFSWLVSTNKDEKEVAAYNKRVDMADGFIRALDLKAQMIAKGEAVFVFDWRKPGIDRGETDFTVTSAKARIVSAFKAAAKAGFLNDAAVLAFQKAAPEELFGVSDVLAVQKDILEGKGKLEAKRVASEMALAKALGEEVAPIQSEEGEAEIPDAGVVASKIPSDHASQSAVAA